MFTKAIQPSARLLPRTTVAIFVGSAHQRIGRRIFRAISFVALSSLTLCYTNGAHAVTIETVLVGNPGNAADSTGFGAVSEPYRIGKYEVTNDQYTEFLNAVAANDTHRLYNHGMRSGLGGIMRSGDSGSYTYNVRPNMANKPVNYVNFWDALRFTNWLHNGQPSGIQDGTTTEDGAYALNGVTSPRDTTIPRDPNATWFLPSEDEWYKAAYHQPAADGGDNDDYWRYPTASNFAPRPGRANSEGDITNPGANIANYNRFADWNGQDGNFTTVGSAGVLSESFYGTSDQGGNAWEWAENPNAIKQTELGGDWFLGSTFMASSFRFERVPSDHNVGGGFRVASIPLGVAVVLQAGDADQDLDFDQFDLIQVQQAARYLTGDPATWGQGDWNGAPGGEVGNPPVGDGLFNQLDIVSAQQAGVYLTGSYSVVKPNGQTGDNQTSVVYYAGTGEMAIDAPAGVELTSINIDSAAGIFTGQAAQNLGGSFDNDANNNLFKATFGGSFGSLSFGNVAQAGLSEDFVLSDLSVLGSLAGGGSLGDVDLVYVPEPTTALLLVAGLVLGLMHHKCLKS